MDWGGQDSYNEDNVRTLADCIEICRKRQIDNFVWVHRDMRCVCKEDVGEENEDEGCISGRVVGDACESKSSTSLQLLLLGLGGIVSCFILLFL